MIKKLCCYIGLFSSCICLIGCSKDNKNTDKAIDIIDAKRAEKASAEDLSDLESTLVEDTTAYFRDTYWGESKANVKENETEQLVYEESDELDYKSVSDGMEIAFSYFFDSTDKLYEAFTYYNGGILSSQEYISEFELMKSSLIEQYGEPNNEYASDSVENSIVENMSDVDAFEKGYRTFGANWFVGDTKIILALFPNYYDEGKALLGITYSDVNNEQYEENEASESNDQTLTDNSNVSAESYDFRNNCWGDSKETVKANEDAEFIGEGTENNLIFKGSLKGSSVYIHYYFEGNSLVQAGYNLVDGYTNGGQYINYYYSVVEGLKEKYGDPYEDEVFDYVDSSLINAAGDSSALEFGYQGYRSQWNVDGKTNISTAMYAENYQINWILLYSDVNYEYDANEGL